MNNFKLFCLHPGDAFELESKSRGFRNDIFVELNDRLYHLNIYDIVRLRQDFDTEHKDSGYFAVEANLVIVSEVTIEEIKSTIRNLAEKELYFELLLEVSDEKRKELQLTLIDE